MSEFFVMAPMVLGVIAACVAIAVLTCGGVFVAMWHERRVARNKDHVRRTAVVSRVGVDYQIELFDGSVWRGDCTVWHSYPNGQRAPTCLESLLSEVWQAERWKEDKDA